MGSKSLRRCSCSQLALLGSPLGDRFVIAAQQDFGNRVAAKLSRSCVLGKLEQPISATERIVNVTLFVAENARQEPDDRVDNYHRGYLASVQDEIANADLFGLENIHHALVKSFVTTTQHQNSVAGRQIFGHSLVESCALRCQQDPSGWPRIHRFDRFDAVHRRLDLDQHPGATTERFIVDRSVRGVGCPVSQIVPMDLNQFPLDRFIQQALGSGIRRRSPETG